MSLFAAAIFLAAVAGVYHEFAPNEASWEGDFNAALDRANKCEQERLSIIIDSINCNKKYGFTQRCHDVLDRADELRKQCDALLEKARALCGGRRKCTGG
jgi:hypothetical protein